MVEKDEKLINNSSYINKNLCEVCYFPKEYCNISHEVLLKKKILQLKAGIKNISKEKIEDNNNTSIVKEDVKNNKTELPNNSNNDDVKNAEDTNENSEKTKKKDQKFKKESKVVLEESKRGKRKHTTYIYHLENYGFILKDISKLLSKKFACSATVSKENGKDCITLTGEFANEVLSFICEKFPDKISSDKFRISKSG